MATHTVYIRGWFFGAVLLLSACQPLSPPTVNSADQQLAIFLAQCYQQDLARSPMLQTYRGIQDNNHRWDSLSEDFLLESEQLIDQRLARLATINLAQLSESSRRSALVYRQLLLNQQGLSRFRHHSYIMQQFRGWHTKIPGFLINMHRIESAADAEAYIQRLYGIQPLLEEVVEQLAIRQRKGILPPQWTYPQMLAAAQRVITGQPFDDSNRDSVLLADFRRKVAALAISESQQQQLVSDARAAMLNAMLPGYRLLIDTLNRQMTFASPQDGVWQLPEGAAYYQQLLTNYTTTDLSAEQIHQLGLQQVERIHRTMQALMQKVNFEGDLAAFFRFMRDDPQFYYPDTEAGKQQYLTNARQRLLLMEQQLPLMFSLLPDTELTIKPVEAFRERSAGKAFYQAPAEDGSRPGIYYVNLHRMRSMPRYQLEALAYHEGLPGHHLQRAITIRLKQLPQVQKYARFTAFSEGWALYAEQLAQEMGAYSDPYSEFGQLTLELWRACRLVVDTGIHAYGWSRSQAIEYLLANTPNAEADARKAIERYIVYPGQATAYLIGKLKILELRAFAQQALTGDFDLRDFHDEVLRHGPVPLSQLEANIHHWVDHHPATKRVQ